MMTTIIKLSKAELEILLPNGCIGINCNNCPIEQDGEICIFLVKLLKNYRRK